LFSFPGDTAYLQKEFALHNPKETKRLGGASQPQ
jgi:hypothetical protein